MASKLMEYFNKSPRIGTLSTADRAGKVDSAVFGSPHMADEKTVVMALGKNRTQENLRENPHAVFLIMEPGEAIGDWKGVRVYLEVKELATSGPLLEGLKGRIASMLGEEAAGMIDAAVRFEVTEVRPLVDMGQGWEQSI
ncbi:pyridoxamine 5'-phosphate oxidase family protein [Methanocalculus sp.]|uniref:pyridoxamine 5'-phosphate oxidase family protein n=1 Tax=Methanocalculus sp. TaxID=2004547 RepID=UPI00260C0251|nr:pyridoxamine 5'-phosphate oxidase family protein [Methanocalculus sp.]MDG6249411.1 pyridoxamine 5'-phosphate oxidase family protein [Methanocalculus sp.]